MRAVVQRVEHARVDVAGECVAEMGRGLLALVGVARGDSEKDARDLANKLVSMRVFEDAEGRMNRSLLDGEGDLCIVSQFTLLADLRKGRRPSFGEAAQPEEAEPMVEAVVQAARDAGVTVVTGRFRAHMKVSLENDGPVTLLVDSRRVF